MLCSTGWPWPLMLERLYGLLMQSKDVRNLRWLMYNAVCIIQQGFSCELCAFFKERMFSELTIKSWTQWINEPGTVFCHHNHYPMLCMLKGREVDSRQPSCKFVSNTLGQLRNQDVTRQWGFSRSSVILQHHCCLRHSLLLKGYIGLEDTRKGRFHVH